MLNIHIRICAPIVSSITMVYGSCCEGGDAIEITKKLTQPLVAFEKNFFLEGRMPVEELPYSSVERDLSDSMIAQVGDLGDEK